MKKEPEGTFHEKGKEPTIERIAQLIKGHPSRSAAARAWGINVNTLNSYFKNVENPPTPRDSVLQRIANNEGVTIEWLLGKSDKLTEEIPKTPENDQLHEMLSFLTNEERARLAVVLARKGVESTLELIFEFANLSPSEFDRAIRLAKQIREGASDGSQEDIVTNPIKNQVG